MTAASISPAPRSVRRSMSSCSTRAPPIAANTASSAMISAAWLAGASRWPTTCSVNPTPVERKAAYARGPSVWATPLSGVGSKATAKTRLITAHVANCTTHKRKGSSAPSRSSARMWPVQKTAQPRTSRSPTLTWKPSRTLSRYRPQSPRTTPSQVQRAARWTWLGVVLGLCGLYLLSVRDGFHVNVGDLLVLGCAVFWTGHILALERLGALDPFRLCVVQFATCAVISLVFAVAFEPTPLSGVAQTLGPLAYAAFLSTGVGFTLQVVGQRDAPASHAALIMALEAVFAAIGGALVLHEHMDLRALLGAGLMLAAVIVAQLGVVWTSHRPVEPLPHVPEP